MEWFETSDGKGADGRKGKYRIINTPEGWVTILNGRKQIGGPSPESQVPAQQKGAERYDKHG